jgi:imidazolonepropionase-like amidohydrolase
MTPAEAEVLDLAGAYVMPGIVNLHGHVGNVVGVNQNASLYTRETVEKDLKTYASYGVTTLLSLGIDQDLIYKLRDEQRAGRPTETRIYTAGQGMMVKGGLGLVAGLTTGILSSTAEVVPAVAAQTRNKVDIVKFWLDDQYGLVPKMPYEMAKAIIDESHKRGSRVAAHIFYLDDAKELVRDGIDALAHAVRDQLVDQALIDSMKSRGTWQIASTLTREASMFAYATTPAFLSDPFFTRSLTPAVIDTLTSPAYQQNVVKAPRFAEYPSYLENAKRNLKKLADAGVKFGMGTDSGPPGRFQGSFEHWEMELMVDAGLTPMQVIVASTRSGAEFLGAKDLGTLEAGKWADLVVLTRNPLDDIRNTRSISSVYIAGNVVH